MAILSDSEIESLRLKWNSKQDIADEVVRVLRGTGITCSNNEIVTRINCALQLLRENGLQLFEATKGVWLETVSPAVKDRVDLPSLDLRCFPFRYQQDLQGIVLSGANLGGSYLEACNLDGAHACGANLDRVQFIDCVLSNAIMSESSLRGARIYGGSFRNADMNHTRLDGVILVKVRLEESNFSFAQFGNVRYFEFEDIFSDDATKREVKRNRISTFRHCFYLPRWRDHFFEIFDLKTFWYNIIKFKKPKNFRGLIKIKFDGRTLWKHLTDRWFYTKFEQVKIEDADTTMASDLFRYVKDQQYLQIFKINHRWIYWIWKVLSDCGGKLSWVGLWSAFIVWLFSKIYPAANAIDPSTMSTLKSNLPDSWLWLFISFDIFSNLGIRNTTPQHPFGVLLMISESVLGLMMLGMLISVLQNRFARRS